MGWGRGDWRRMLCCHKWWYFTYEIPGIALEHAKKYKKCFLSFKPPQISNSPTWIGAQVALCWNRIMMAASLRDTKLFHFQELHILPPVSLDHSGLTSVLYINIRMMKAVNVTLKCYTFIYSHLSWAGAVNTSFFRHASFSDSFHMETSRLCI